MKLILATHNRDKVREISRMLQGPGLTLHTTAEFPDVPEPVEDGDTLEANAMIKARAIRDATGMSALADDTGLEVAALGGAPGVYAARYSGPDATYESNCAKLLHEMIAVPAGKRGAVFRTVMALAMTPEDSQRVATALDERAPGISPDASAEISDRDVLLSEGMLPGEIASARAGEDGFGYDPVFYVPSHGRTLAEFTVDEKNAVSHRYRALVEMKSLMIRAGLVDVTNG